MDRKTKYVIIDDGLFTDVILFGDRMNHSEFQRFHPTSAGFVFITNDIVSVYGKSVTLGLTSRPEDAEIIAEELGFRNDDRL